MQTNNEYYKEICENMGITVDSGVHNNNYYLKKIAVEGYGLDYTGTVCNGILIKDIAEQITGYNYTGHHFINFYLKDIAHALTGEDYNKQFDNYYLNIWANNIVRKEETTLSWTPPTNLVYSDEFNATGVLTSNNQPLKDKTVYLMIGSYTAGTGVTDSNGSVSFTATPVHSGRHTFSLVFKGDVGYSSCENSATIDVSKETSFLNMTSKNTFYTNEDVVLTGVLLDDEQEPIAGKYVAPFGVTDSNGVFSANMGRVNVGTYTFNDISFTDDDYTGNTISHTIQVIEPYIDLTSDKSILSYADHDTATLTATIHNKTVNGVTVTFYDGNDNVIGTGTTDNTGVAVCDTHYQSQGTGDVTLRAEATVDGIFLSKTFVIEDCRKYISSISQSFTSGLGWYGLADLGSNLSDCDITFKMKSTAQRFRFDFATTNQSENKSRIALGTNDNGVLEVDEWNSGGSLTPHSISQTYALNSDISCQITRDNNQIIGKIDNSSVTVSDIANLRYLGVTTWSGAKTVTITDLKVKPL